MRSVEIQPSAFPVSVNTVLSGELRSAATGDAVPDPPSVTSVPS